MLCGTLHPNSGMLAINARVAALLELGAGFNPERRFRETGTILFVSHDTGAVVNLCQRAMWLQDGAVRALGPPKEIAEAYLANLYEAQQGPSAVHASAAESLSGASATAVEFRDQRLAYLNQSK